MAIQEQAVTELIGLIQKAKANTAGRTHVDAIVANIQAAQAYIPGTVDFAIGKLIGENEPPKLNKTDEDLAVYILHNCSPTLLVVAKEILKQVATYDGPPASPRPKLGRDIVG